MQARTGAKTRNVTMKNLILAAGLTAIATTFSSAAHAQDKPVLTVYTYDSFVSDWGPGPAVEKAFEATCECDLQLVGAGDGAALLSRVQLEGARSDACLLYTSPSPRDKRQSRMPSSA